MKNRIRVACLVGAGVAVAAFAACSGTTEPTVAPDAAATPAPSAIPTGSTLAPAPLADAASPRDATTDEAAFDAPDGALVADAMDAADGYDGAPLPGSVETVADIPGLTDFDFVGDHLVYHAMEFLHCTLPICTDKTLILRPPYAGPPARPESGWTAGDSLRFHFISVSAAGGGAYIDHISVLLDGSDMQTSRIAGMGGAAFAGVSSYHGGHVGAVLVRSGYGAIGGTCQRPPCTHEVFNLAGGTNTGRVARATGLYHTNYGNAVAYYTPSYRPDGVSTVSASFDGVSAPVPATQPTLVAVSAAGPTVPHPTVVVLRDGNVEACPLATPCLAWLNLGALGTILNLDDRHLYVGTPTGLSRCALSEIATAGTCTLVPHGPVEAVEEPLYLTTTHAWYRSGTQVRRVLK